MNDWVCVGLVLEKGSMTFQEHGAAILASGGLDADFMQGSMLGLDRPALMHLPTNGAHCTGDGFNIQTAYIQ